MHFISPSVGKLAMVGAGKAFSPSGFFYTSEPSVLFLL